MTSSRSKVFSGPEFSGDESLEVDDITDWIVEGAGGEAAKQTLDNFEWNGGAVMGITLQTSPDNRKLTNSSVFLTGELMKGNKEVRANQIFDEADKELRISYIIEEASILTFKSGTLIGDVIDDDKIPWSVIKKNNRGTTEVDSSEYEGQKIGHFCLRPYLVLISSTKARLTILVFPTSLADLEASHSHWRKAAFPGMELMQADIFCTYLVI